MDSLPAVGQEDNEEEDGERETYLLAEIGGVNLLLFVLRTNRFSLNVIEGGGYWWLLLCYRYSS